MNKNKYTFWRFLWTDMKANLTPGRLVGQLIGGLIMPFLIGYLSLVISDGIKDIPSAFSYLQLYLASLSAVFMFMFARILMVVRDKATVDKNKAAFLYYNKNKVTLAKLIIEGIMFTVSYFVLFSIGIIIIAAKGVEGFDYDRFGTLMITVFVGILVMYLFIFTATKWIISFVPKKGLGFFLAILLTLIFLVPSWILVQISDTSALRVAFNNGTFRPGSSPTLNDSWFAQNQLATAFIPIMNFEMFNGVGIKIGTGPNGVQQLKEDWYVIIPIIYSIIFLVGTWVLQSSAQKRYLASS